MSPGNHVLDASRSPMGRGNYKGKWEAVRRHSDTLPWAVQKSIKMPLGLWTRVGLRKHVLDGAQIPHANGQLLGERTWPGMSDDTLPWAVQKWLHLSVCRLGCDSGGPKKARVQSYSTGGATPMYPHGRAYGRHLANTIKPSVCGSDAALCQITLTTCCVFLLPLIE